jgi:hypothetical protein
VVHENKIEDDAALRRAEVEFKPKIVIVSKSPDVRENNPDA